MQFKLKIKRPGQDNVRTLPMTFDSIAAAAAHKLHGRVEQAIVTYPDGRLARRLV